MSIYFLNAEYGYSQALVDEVISTVRKYLDAAIQDLSIKKPFDTTIYPKHTWTEESDGVDGDAFSGGLLQIRLDLRGEKIKINELLGNPLKAVVYHECNHISRWQTVGYGTSLIEATISEGIATSYEKYICSPYVIKHGDYSDIEKLLPFYTERNRDDDETYNHWEWFFGTHNKYPRWLGYKVGTYIVEEALKQNRELSFADLTALPAKDIMNLSKVTL